MLSQLLLFCLANFGRSRVCVCGLYRYLDLAEGILKVSLVGLSRYHKMSYDTIPAEVSRYQVVSRYHQFKIKFYKMNQK